MKQQHGLVLLEVVIFLILISLGYIGWMNVRKNISEYDYAMQVTRNLCFYKEKLGQYIKNNNNIISTSTKKITFSDLGISNSSGYPASYPEYNMELYVNGKTGYIVLLRANNLDIHAEQDSITRMVINSAVGFLSVSLFPFNGSPQNNLFHKNSDISGPDGYYTLKGIDLSKYNKNDVIAIVMVPETLTPFQECYYGF
ncbi:hypothetical protein ABJ952_004690 [Escherichia coli]|uniref:hypothetical protein n=1 Tax=Escherichia coli TaxID=562 RepID=UPI000510DBCE|nr:hypothetical protein [Escherichia coli]EFI5243745.1 hypothetical protein [Escherichia coli]EFN9930714.1 hypothetical protein [Escherichia coli]EGE3724768.1 hypothetical protein [Escherichia coli]EIC1693247.1 hypothetical protein [Escherichia coli]HBL5656941.1 hypothetical protein [Escherichia coli]